MACRCLIDKASCCASFLGRQKIVQRGLNEEAPDGGLLELQQRLQASNDFKVQSTPTVFVNGDRYGGGMPLDQFRTLLNGMISE